MHCWGCRRALVGTRHVEQRHGTSLNDTGSQWAVYLGSPAAHSCPRPAARTRWTQTWKWAATGGPQTPRVTPGHSCCSAANPGGSARVSATVSCAPARAHQRAIARPDAPRPRISTCWSCSCSTAYLSFKVDRPTRHSSMVMIQKRTTTCVSFQPLFSKWWCKGAIFRMRRPSPYLRRVYLK